MRGGIACGIARSVVVWETQMHHPPKSLWILYYGSNSVLFDMRELHRKLERYFKTVFLEEDLGRFKYENNI